MFRSKINKLKEIWAYQLTGIVYNFVSDLEQWKQFGCRFVLNTKDPNVVIRNGTEGNTYYSQTQYQQVMD